jgi:hypothetical protein
MFSARVLSRAVARQQPILRRFNSNTAHQIIQGSKAEGNAFIAEREAIRKHAAESAGSSLHLELSLESTN